MMQDRETGWFRHGRHILQIVMERGEVSHVTFVRKAGGTGTQTPEMAFVSQLLESYFAGSGKGFKVKIRLQGTEFQKAVWEAVRKIPYGETRSYKEIAVQIGRPRAFRAVGQAIHNNPLAIIIPCHRVIGSDGSLTGYAGGLALKKWLLEHESKVGVQK